MRARQTKLTGQSGRIPDKASGNHPTVPEDRTGRPGSRWGVLIGLTLVTFLLLLDDTAVSVALPSIQKQLGLGFGGLEWVVNAYTLTIAAFTLMAGRLADRNGARRIFLIGLAIFVIGSLSAGISPTPAALIAFRAAQGLGAALVAPAALALIAITFPAERRGMALGVWAGVSASALGIGPLIGALVNDALGWQWIFLLNVPLGSLGWLSASFLLPKSRPPVVRMRLDMLGVCLSAVGLLSLILVLDQANAAGWASPLVIGLSFTTVTSLALFVVHENRTHDPLVNLSLFADRFFAGANLVTLLSTAVMCSLFFFLALYLQTVLGYTALASGATLLPLTLTIILIAPLAGRLADRFGVQLLIVVGMLILAGALIGMSTLGLRGDAPILMFWLAVAGFGIALAKTPTTTAALGGADASNYGIAAGVLNTFQAAGLALGIALMGAILTSFGPSAAFDRSFDARHHEAFVQGFSTALAINGGIAAFAAVLAAVMLRSRRAERKP